MKLSVSRLNGDMECHPLHQYSMHSQKMHDHVCNFVAISQLEINEDLVSASERARYNGRAALQSWMSTRLLA